MKKECSNLKVEIDRLGSEREVLLSKIDAGDGINTVLKQLKQQNVSLLPDRNESKPTDNCCSKSVHFETSVPSIRLMNQEESSHCASVNV